MSGKNYLTYNAVRVVCPFYNGEDKLDVRCEGLQRGATLVNHFPTPRRKQGYMDSFCQSLEGCRQCPIHGMMTRVWNQWLA